MQRMSHLITRTALLLTVLLGTYAHAFFDEKDSEFLPVREAFRLTLASDDHGFTAHWQVTPGHYLYRDKFAFKVVDDAGQAMELLGSPQAPQGELKDDEIFGRVEVFHQDVAVRVPLIVQPGVTQATLKITYQGCADAGLCYPPETESWPVDFTGMSPDPEPEAFGPVPPAAAPATQSSGTRPDASDAGAIARFLGDASFLAIVGTFLLLGIGLALTPCVLPMVPILSSIIVGEGRHISARRGFTLSLAYVLGMALTYTAAGVAVGFLGAQFNIQLWLQSPPVLIVFSLLFVLLAISMFGFYELQLPAFLRDRLTAVSGRQEGGHLLPVAVMGAISALIVSPCVSAPLAGALVFIGSTGDALLGGSALFALAMGMGAPLLLIGASGGKLLPKAGAWMNGVKALFGVALLGVAITLLARLLPGWIILALWGSLLVVSAIYLKALEPLATAASGWAHFRKGVGLVLMLYGATLLIGAAGGAEDPLEPLGFLKATANAQAGDNATAESPLFTPVATPDALAERLAAARAAGRPVMVDFFAEWCISCKIMERDVFSRPAVHAALAGYEVLQADVTRPTDTNRAFLGQWNIVGLPAILFFAPDGSELTDARILGELDAAGFLAWVETRIEPKLR
ncbi:MAG: protein-disulfide reductase DsbD [Gammaproteobacteria bacterium]